MPGSRITAAEFRRGIFRIVAAALIFVPVSGIVTMTFVGIYPWPDLLYVLIEYSGPVIAVNVLLILKLTGRLVAYTVRVTENGMTEQRIRLEQKIKSYLPPVFFGFLFLYTLQGVLSANLSLDHFHGYDHDVRFYVYSFYGMLPAFLISAFPIYFYLTDQLGRYLAPRGFKLVIAPMWFKLMILGLFTPLLIDTVLLLYYYDRTAYLTGETIGLWFVLLFVAALGTRLAWRSLQQSLSPITELVEAMETNSRLPQSGPAPQSLDEIGALTGRYADLLNKSNRMEHDLSYERKFANAVLENANALVLVQDREGRIRRFNRACEELTGYTFEEIQGGYVWDYLLDPKDAEDIRVNTFEALVKNPRERSGRYTNSWILKDRSKRKIDWSKSALLDQDGNTEFIVSIGIDITDKHEAEQELIQAYQIQQLLISISRDLESAKNHYDIIDAIGPRVKEALGYSGCWLYLLEDEADGRFCRMIAHSPDRLNGEAQRPDIVRFDMTSSPILRELYKAKDIVTVEDARTDPRVTPERAEATRLRTIINAPLTLEGRWFGMVGIGSFGEEGPRPPSATVLSFMKTLGAQVATVCDRIDFEARLAQSNDELEERVEARTRELREAQDELLRRERLATLGQLTATVSHELRNPLGAMRPSTYILRKKLADDESTIKALERIERGIDRCDHIIDELLDFTRITTLEKSRQSLDDWVQAIVDEQRFPDNVRVNVHYGLDGMKTEFDPHRLRRALVNILDNAAQSLVSEKDGSVRDQASIELATQVRDNRIELQLRDNGTGIPEAVLPRIFEPLFSTKNFGVGLGMPTVKQIMEQHGGGIEIESTKGQGTRVVLWLPVDTNTDAKSTTVH